MKITIIFERFVVLMWNYLNFEMSKTASNTNPLKNNNSKGASANADHKLSYKNLQLQSFSSQNTHSIPINETLEDALIDLYLSVKIRSNEEVSKPLNLILTGNKF